MIERIRKINQLLKQEIGSIITREIEFPENTLLTITGVDTSKDLHHAKVFVSILPAGQSERLMRMLTSARIEHLLHKKLHMKPLPRLHFVIDNTEEKASKIEFLLDAH